MRSYMPKSLNERLYKLTLAAMFLAVALILPFLTGQIQPIAKKFCLMHIPVLLCGFFCGPWYAMMVGTVAPLLRFVMFSMPPVMPTGLAMSFELAAYGFLAGWLYRILPRKRIFIYVSLLLAMLGGRIIWGIVSLFLYGTQNSPFTWNLFMADAFGDALPGIILQIVLIPVLVMAVNRILKHADNRT